MIIKLFDEYTNVDDVKEIIIDKAVICFRSMIQYDEKEAKKLLDFFINKGYDIDDNLENVAIRPKAFKYFLEKGVNPNSYKTNQNFLRLISALEIQKILIDFGYELLIHDTVGFNAELKNDPKYFKVVDKFDNMKKYNIGF
jgi:hypothetical protein